MEKNKFTLNLTEEEIKLLKKALEWYEKWTFGQRNEDVITLYLNTCIQERENKKKDYETRKLINKPEGYEVICSSGKTDIDTDNLGKTDISAATIVWFDRKNKLKTGTIRLSRHGYFNIYSSENIEAETLSYYKSQMTIKPALIRIYDDKELIFEKYYYGKTVEILTSGNSIILKERGR